MNLNCRIPAVAQWLKRGATAAVKAESEADRKVRDISEAPLTDIERHGDAAVRELSIKFDNWDRPGIGRDSL
jgi:sulfopropanediol 3-dehydrogenase